MSKNNENKSVPKLRFPEFRNDEGWEETTLGKVSDITNGKSNAQDHVENGKYPLFDRSAVIKASNNFLFDCEAVIIPGEGMRFTPKYFKGKFDLHQRAYVLKDFIIDGMFAYYSLIHRSDLLALKAVKSTVLSLRLPILQNFPIQIPRSQSEQQKIAACLSSLDELITAERQKLEVLKQHKKGLLQNLFPQEGETVPRLRFPEFKDSGEWEEFFLSEVSPAIFDGTHQTPTYTENGVPFYSVENIISKSKNKFISREDYLLATFKNKPEKGDIIITRIGNIGTSKVIDWDYEFSVYVTLAIVKKSPLFNSYYLHGYFQSSRYQKEILSKSLLNAVPCKINMDQLRKTKILLPPDKEKKEQQKIAACLSALDDLIHAQTQKIEALQLHKKGLLQGLFPNVHDGDNG